MGKLLKLIFLALLTGILTGCGGGGTSSSSSEQLQETSSPIDGVLEPTGGDEVIKQFVDSVVSGLPYKSVSKDGSKELENKTTNLGQFITYKGGHTSFSIGNVNLGTWQEPESSNDNEIVQLSNLTYEKSANSCASPDSTTSARILLGINEGGNDNYIQIVDDKELIGCPEDGDEFYEENNLSVTIEEVTDHLDETSDRLKAYSAIASLLFNKDAKDINYNYNGYKAVKENQSGCDGYDGGHAGVDFQTKSVAGDKTADETVYSLTEGKVVLVDKDKGRVIIETKIKGETVRIGYLHLRDIKVTQGESYSKNTSIGIQGNLGLGYSDANSAEHVHVEVRSSSYLGAACGAVTSYDPLEYFEAIIKEPSVVSLPDYLEGTYYFRKYRLVLKPDEIKSYAWINGSWKLDGEGKLIEIKEINASTSDVIVYDEWEGYIKARLEKEGSNLKFYWYEDNDVTLEGARAAVEYELDAIYSSNPVDLTSLFDINSIDNMLDILPPSEYFPAFSTGGILPFSTYVRREYNHVENTDEFISYLTTRKGFTLDTSRQSSEPDAIYYSNGSSSVRVSDDGYNVSHIELGLDGEDYTKAKFESVFAESQIQGEFRGILINRYYNESVADYYKKILEENGFTKYRRNDDHYSERYNRENTGNILGTISEVWFQPDSEGSIIWNLESW
ncbi:MAG: M23 family metallopeptidase [Campylobacteraceae bacterium]|jgi:murein DD-endopeptidase MepM/ murein hydrolase activator NlpD|nr:M23 family metallopeptidase [Campylobacteraceae bacterium]